MSCLRHQAEPSLVSLPKWILSAKEAWQVKKACLGTRQGPGRRVHGAIFSAAARGQVPYKGLDVDRVC